MYCTGCPEIARRAQYVVVRSLLLFLLLCAVVAGYGAWRWGAEQAEQIELLKANVRLQGEITERSELYRQLAERNTQVCEHALYSVAYRLGLDLDKESLPVVYANASMRLGGMGPTARGKKRVRR